MLAPFYSQEVSLLLYCPDVNEITFPFCICIYVLYIRIIFAFGIEFDTKLLHVVFQERLYKHCKGVYKCNRTSGSLCLSRINCRKVS